MAAHSAHPPPPSFLQEEGCPISEKIQIYVFLSHGDGGGGHGKEQKIYSFLGLKNIYMYVQKYIDIYIVLRRKCIFFYLSLNLNIYSLILISVTSIGIGFLLCVCFFWYVIAKAIC